MKRETIMTTSKNRCADRYFGVCPHCHLNDGFINVGPTHWFVCHEHKVMWCEEVNLFSGWIEQSEEEQRRIYDKYDIGSYQKVIPMYGDEENKVAAQQLREIAKRIADGHWVNLFCMYSDAFFPYEIHAML